MCRSVTFLVNVLGAIFLLPALSVWLGVGGEERLGGRKWMQL